MNGDVKAIFSLYRSCLRQIRRLPTEYLRQFFRLRVGDDVRAILDPRLAHLQPTKQKLTNGTWLQDLRKLEGANTGYAKCFDYVLNTAYGRRGPLKWEILDPLRSEPGAELPPRIIPAVESSRPPLYSQEMKALLTSEIAQSGRALTPAALEHPPTLPPRADPNSPEARALGPFSKRREARDGRALVSGASRVVGEVWRRMDGRMDGCVCGYRSIVCVLDARSFSFYSSFSYILLCGGSPPPTRSATLVTALVRLFENVL
ncbi:hypothetical protein NUW54_g10365 [Trametes sanguinea]|uniref:Uncharacterized protein n=1 Tax=Trametes sanguinea TaxID=158606 RepID=A0ACC1P0U2_9APHY|nr:hypothetical protein NUW54_g10365 [Trametes sanguinea]